MTPKRIFAGLLIASSLMLGGCGQNSDQPDAPQLQQPVTLPPEALVATESVTEPPVIAATEPPVTVPETAEAVPEATEPLLEEGPGIIVDGTRLSGSVLTEDDTVWVAAGEFLTAAEELELSGDDAAGYTAVKDGETLEFLPDGSSSSVPVMTYRETLYVPVDSLCEPLNISLLEDPERNDLYCTSAAGEIEIEPGVQIPILMYHGVTDDLWGSADLFVSPSALDAQLNYLQQNGYQTITFEDWDHLEDFDKPVMLTFDDGYLDNYEEAFPILQKYNAKATIFLITVSVDRDPRTMTSQQAREMMDSGLVSIQSHTASHLHLSQCDDEELDLQIRLSQLAIARMVGREPFVLCYPYGDSSARSRELTMEYYQFGLMMNGGLYTTGQPLDQITRYYVSRYTTLDEFAGMVSGAGR